MAQNRSARALRLAGRLAVTTAIVALSVGLVVGGRTVLADRLTAPAELQPAPFTTVQVERIALQSRYDVTRRFAGQFEAAQTTGLAFEEGGTLAEILVNEGTVVAAGEVVARLDARLLDAERARLGAMRDAIAAQVELARRTNVRQAELRDRGFASNQVVDDTSLTLVRLDAQMAEVDAALAAVDVRLSKAVLRAPFPGIVGERVLDVGAVAGPGVQVLTLLEDSPVRFRAGVDPQQLKALSTASELTVQVGGSRLPARFDRTGPELEVATRTQTVFFTTDGPTPPPGSAGEVIMTVETQSPVPGTWLPLSALRQGPRGSWQVLIVENAGTANVIGLAAVELIHAAQTSAFVAGTLRNGQAVVSVGTHRVVPGERVNVETRTLEVASWEG